jgi:hypothetical protein
MLTASKAIDHGPNAGVRILDTAGELPLTIMQSLPNDMQRTAQIFEKLHDEKMSVERWNPADQVRIKYSYGAQHRIYF